MNDDFDSGVVELHLRACDCDRCNPRQVRETSAVKFPSVMISMQRSQWLALNRPLCIEDYYELAYKGYNPRVHD